MRTSRDAADARLAVHRLAGQIIRVCVDYMIIGVVHVDIVRLASPSANASTLAL